MSHPLPEYNNSKGIDKNMPDAAKIAVFEAL